MNLYEKLKEALGKEIQKHGLSGQNISVRCRVLSVKEAIGKPEHDDYPLIKGREVMVEAVFKGAKGQAFTDEFQNADFPVDNLLQMALNSNRERSVFNHLGSVIKPFTAGIPNRRNALIISPRLSNSGIIFFLSGISQGFWSS